MSKISWPDWWSKNNKLEERHFADCINGRRCLEATIDREIIAFIVWGTFWNKIHLQDVFVRKECRRAGIGKALIEKAIIIGKKDGCKEVMSDCDVSNKASIHLHLKSGFKKCGYIKNNWGNESSHVFSRKI